MNFKIDLEPSVFFTFLGFTICGLAISSNHVYVGILIIGLISLIGGIIGLFKI